MSDFALFPNSTEFSMHQSCLFLENVALKKRIEELEAENKRLDALFENQQNIANEAQTALFFANRQIGKWACQDCEQEVATHYTSLGYHLCWSCMHKEGQFRIVGGEKYRSMI
jgi:hypothetical protein